MIKSPEVSIIVEVGGEPTVLFDITHNMELSEAEKLINKWGAHRIVRSVYGIPKNYSLRAFMRTNERVWEDK